MLNQLIFLLIILEYAWVSWREFILWLRFCFLDLKVYIITRYLINVTLDTPLDL